MKHAELIVENMHCGGCMQSVERALSAVPGVEAARANLSARRAAVTFDPGRTSPAALVEALARAGFRAAERVEAPAPAAELRRDRDLLRRLAVAGFAAANIMLLSVSVWAGLASDMDQSAATLFHWLSAAIVLPAIVYAGQPFFRSAAGALGAHRLNMDVPISLGILLATGMSLYQTARASEQVYFDAAIMLTFFLLIGRYLDERVRTRARGAAENLMGLKALSAAVIGKDGVVRRVPARLIEPGQRILVAAGERIPADGRIVSGATGVDEGLITGETVPRRAAAGDDVFAGTVNLSAPVEIEATAADHGTLIAEIARLMAAAEQGRGRYVRLADRAARLYAPLVHALGLLTFTGWMLAGAGWEQALTTAIAVLIVTCPCALALAVPAVQVAAVSRLSGKGIIVKAADGLERLAEVDTIVFDKTGTLTLGEPRLSEAGKAETAALAGAAALAASSRHPYSRALQRTAEARGLAVIPRPGVREVPGCGLEFSGPDGEERLGSAAFAGGPEGSPDATLWYARPGVAPVGFRFEDTLRSDAWETVTAAQRAGYRVELLSGDRTAEAAAAARAAGIGIWRGEVRPDGKLAHLAGLKAAGRRVLMVGDGLNDAPALAAAHASLSPAAAADISQNAADAIFQGEKLAPVLETLAVARRTRRMAFENFAIALGYNAVFVPLAMAGLVTPLIAAIAMSASSIAVTANALRLPAMRLSLKALAGETGKSGEPQR